MTKRCTQCLISENVPGVSLDDLSICNLCLNWKFHGKKSLLETREALKFKLEEAIENSRHSASEYHCILAYSGGKDSTYALYILTQKYKLKVLAVTIDNGFVAEAAFTNGRATCDELGCDWVVFRPAQTFMRAVYRNSLEKSPYDKKTLARSSEVCTSCIQVVNSVVLREAIRRQIPLIAGGYIGTQVPADTPVMKTSLTLEAFKKKSLEELNLKLHPEFSRYVGLSESEKKVATEFSPVIINPLLLEDYNEAEVIKTIQTIGWKLPTTTGKNSSNCLLNEYAILEHATKYGFHPYELEICQQIRRGFLSKEEGMARLNYRADSAYYEKTRTMLLKP